VNSNRSNRSAEHPPAQSRAMLKFTLPTAALIVLSLAQAHADEPQLLMSFQGKGSSVAYDVGVVSRVYDHMPAMQENRVVISASSSGSILATYFSTHGFSRESIDELARLNAGLDRQAIRDNENLTNKASKVMSQQPIEMPHDVLKATVAAMLGVESYDKQESIREVARRSQLKIKLPVVIVAANYEVIHVTKRSLQDFRPLDRNVDHDSYSVSWKDESFVQYRQNPARFRQLHPDLKLSESQYVGKACTYFCDQTMFDLLSQIPQSERLGDLRLMTGPEDLALALVASASEPTYFNPIQEWEPAKLMAGEQLGDMGNSIRRLYCGGFIMPVVAQDIRRVQPQLFTFNSGGGDLPNPVKIFLESNYLLNYNRIQRQNDYWVDISAVVPTDIYRRMAARDLTDKEEFAAGFTKAAECLQTGRSLPRYVVVPKYNYPLRSNQETLATMRGLPQAVATK
jgi:hypothetical protein